MPGPSPVNSACLDDGQEPTGCCKFPPNISVELEYVSARQDCNDTSCGELPCTSSRSQGSVPEHDYTETTNYEDTNNVKTITYRNGGASGTVVAREQYANATGAVGTLYDGDGNCITTEQVCSPNWADLTISEKCAAKRYLTITEVDRSGGENHGRTRVRQYTADEDGNCDLETTCSGSRTETTVETGIFTTVTGPTAACSSATTSGGSEVTTTLTTTWNNDCTSTEETECTPSGSSNSSFTCTSLFGGDTSTSICESDYLEIDGECQWQGEQDGTDDWGDPIKVPFDDNCLESSELFNSATFESTLTITPSRSCKVTTTYTEANEQGDCIPKTFPDFPAFTDCTPEGEEPPESPELPTGQGYEEDAFRYVSPTNPASKSEQKIRFRVKHTPTGTCYLKVWFRKVIQKWKYEDCATGFEGDPPRTESWEGVVNCEDNPCTSRWSTDGAPTFEAAGTYEWRGTGYPCFSDDAKPPSYCVNAIYSSQPVTVAATGNQSIFIEFKYSQLEGYEPNWGDENGYQGCKPNGFPIPNPADCPEPA